MRVEISGVKELQRFFKRLDKDAQCHFLRFMADETYEKAKKRIAKHHKTGNMEHNLYKKASCKKGISQIGVHLEGTMVKWKGQKISYAVFMHEGTTAHFIHPKFKKAIRWVKQGGDKSSFAFAKAVRHPGYEGDPFLTGALEEASKNIEEKFWRWMND